MVAEMEIGLIKARQRDGIERAKCKGDVYKGREPTIDPLAVRHLFNEGIGASEIARRPLFIEFWNCSAHLELRLNFTTPHIP
jgi:DNA invertase Pin-like site-specific DNA recombinase